MKLKLPVPFIVVVLWTVAVTASALPQTPAADLLLGTWRIDGHANAKEHRGSWFLEWTFADGKFKEDGYPPLTQSGSYRVVHTESDKLTLELYAQKGTFGTKNSRLEVVVYRDKDQLKIGSNAPFHRVKSKPAKPKPQ